MAFPLDHGDEAGAPKALEEKQRAAVVACAQGWLRTPYHHHANVKGAGVDCAFLLLEVYVEAGLIERFDPGHYPADWMMHRDEERYLATIERFARRQLGDDETPGPGDVVAWRFGRCFSHGAIVTRWPYVIHAYARSGVVEELNVEQDEGLMRLKSGEPRPRRFYSLWGSRQAQPSGGATKEKP
jgi:cell wall-associated NlpC family hydrolase